MDRIQTDVRKSITNNVATTTATQLSPINCEGLIGGKTLYANNLGTTAIYLQFKGCGINASSTSHWANIGATATVAASGASFFGDYNVTGLSGTYNYLTVEYVAAATGAVSACFLQLTVF